MDISSDRKRYFIVSVGRTGTTLLAAALADAGADFGMPAPDDWDRRAGHLEHPEMGTAIRLNSFVQKLAKEPPFSIQKQIMRWRRKKAHRAMKDALESATYFKYLNLEFVARFAARHGYHPIIILSYRRFDEHVMSAAPTRLHLDLDAIADSYVRVYRDGMLLKLLFGGCAVDFADLIDRGETDWADSLARLTGLSRERLIEARDKRVRPATSRSEQIAALNDPRTSEVYEMLRQSQAVTEPAPRAIRNRRKTS